MNGYLQTVSSPHTITAKAITINHGYEVEVQKYAREPFPQLEGI